MNLFLAPHSDDEALFGSYIILRHKPVVMVCIESEGQELRKRRREESRAAMAVLEAPVVFLSDYTNGQFIGREKNVNWGALHLCLKQYRLSHPRLERVFAPQIELGEANEEHQKLALIAESIFSDILTVYATYTWPEGKTVTHDPVPFEEGWPRKKMMAQLCYQSQLENPYTASHFEESLIEYYGER